ncbi:hypothetical protein EDC96DRAFT_504123 [Choanephora cucurbitarum]|nr:hypothetical protein EDC96DRAFT_504123 [Choanephora cucurbitarum]
MSCILYMISWLILFWIEFHTSSKVIYVYHLKAGAVYLTNQYLLSYYGTNTYSIYSRCLSCAKLFDAHLLPMPVTKHF